MEIVTTIYLWTFRISILVLFYLVFIDLKRNKTNSSIIVFIGLSIILSAIFMDIITWYFFMRKFFPIYIFEKIHVISMLLTSTGYVISVYGCFKKFYIKK